MNQIKHATKILLKYKLYSTISLVGLVIACASFWFIATFVMNSNSHDAFHDNANQIYRITMQVSSGEGSDHYATTGLPPGQLLREGFSGIDAYGRFSEQSNVVKSGNEVYKESGIYDTNAEVLDMFSFDLLSGNKSNCFAEPYSIIISNSLAKKYFGNLDVLSKQISVGSQLYSVTGVFKDWPNNSHIDVEALTFSKEFSSFEGQDWFNLDNYNYVLLNPALNQKDLDQKLDELIQSQLAPILEGSGIEAKLHAQPLHKIYYDDALIDDTIKGDELQVKTLAFAGILVLLIAGLNYINLTLTQSTQRTKEITIKKILGISKFKLWLQSCSESGMMTIAVFIGASALVMISQGYFQQVTGIVPTGFPNGWMLILLLMSVIFFFGLAGTSYSGIYLINSSRLTHPKSSRHQFFKKSLLSVQLIATSGIIVITLIMNKQIQFINSKDLGFDRESIVYLELSDDQQLPEKRKQFSEKLKTLSSVSQTAMIGGGAMPGEDNGKEIFGVSIKGATQVKIFNFYRIDENFFDLLEIELADGRNYEALDYSKGTGSIIVNQALVDEVGWKNPLEETIQYGEDEIEVIGVVKNFHHKSLRNPIEPIVFINDNNFTLKILVKSDGNDKAQIKTVWKEFFPDEPFSMGYYDSFIENMYRSENNLIKLLSAFSLVDLAICSIGLFAIFSLYIHQKMRELSIRKVLGANGWNLIQCMSQNYLWLIVGSIIISMPLAGYFAFEWLKQFSYKVTITPVSFIVAGIIVFMTIILSLAYHIRKAVKINPAEQLKVD